MRMAKANANAARNPIVAVAHVVKETKNELLVWWSQVETWLFKFVIAVWSGTRKWCVELDSVGFATDSLDRGSICCCNVVDGVVSSWMIDSKSLTDCVGLNSDNWWVDGKIVVSFSWLMLIAYSVKIVEVASMYDWVKVDRDSVVVLLMEVVVTVGLEVASLTTQLIQILKDVEVNLSMKS